MKPSLDLSTQEGDSRKSDPESAIMKIGDNLTPKLNQSKVGQSQVPLSENRAPQLTLETSPHLQLDQVMFESHDKGQSMASHWFCPSKC